MNSPYGSPTGEIYDAEFDGAGVGLYKPGPVPSATTSTRLRTTGCCSPIST
jgi:hypothetical protein